ncbi:MAG: 23S rRNA G2445 N2-methylase RlmL [Bacteroidia bacterium]|jgi:23S rRNA G2445 N2-methylase RlmL
MVAPKSSHPDSTMSSHHILFATCAPGLEPLLHAELRGLKFAKVERQVGGCYFEAMPADIWRANLGLRSAVRVLLRLSRFEARTGEELYANVKAIDWTTFVKPTGTLRVDAKVKDSELDHSNYVEQRVKDAVADQFVDKFGERPSVDKDEPDLRIAVHIFRDRVTLQVDTSGHSLHRRGYRQAQGRAPLAETLAAAIVMSTGWNLKAPVIDPFCGSGTLLIEAGLLATNTAPGLFRKSFGFQNWEGHDAAGFAKLKDKLRAEIRPLGKTQLIGSDIEPGRLEDIEQNAEAAGLGGKFKLEVGDACAFDFKPGWNACVITNPPYGERIGDVRDLVPTYREFGERLRKLCGGYEVAIFSGNEELAKELYLENMRSLPLKNGAINCEIIQGVLPEKAVLPEAD